MSHRTSVDTPVLALHYVREEFPELQAREAVHIEDTWCTHAFLIDDTWLFRFPKTDNAERLYKKERALLPRLAPHLDVAVANIEWVSTLPDGRTFMGHRLIHGEPLTREALGAMSDADRRAVAGQIAGFLRGVHGFPVQEARDIGVEEDDRPKLVESIRQKAERRVYPQLTQRESEQTDRLLRQFVEDPANAAYETSLTHMDLWGRHLLMNPLTRAGDASPKLAGVIDYGSTCVGDPNYDFFPVTLEFGEAFGREVLAAYDHPDPDRAIRNASFYCALDAVACWMGSEDDGLEDQIDDSREYLRKALAGFKG